MLNLNLHPGVTERALQIELEAEFARHGATRPGYGTIIGTGPNAAVLHFEPSARAALAGEFVLVDAGAEIDRYMADVTRTFVVDRPTMFQRDFYQVVLAAQERAIARCVPGAEWKDIHLACAADMVAGLVDLGLMRGKPESLVEQEAHPLAGEQLPLLGVLLMVLGRPALLDALELRPDLRVRGHGARLVAERAAAG